MSATDGTALRNTTSETGVIVRNIARPSAGIIARLGRLPIANISDAMNKHGVMHHEIRPVRPGHHMCGPALTCGSLDLTVKIYAISLLQHGDVYVQASGGISEYACFGELASNGVKGRGGVGAIIDGAVRDISGIKEVGLPVFARSVTPRNYHYPFGQSYGSINQPVVCGGVVVNPGDVVVAGDDGIVVVPQQIAADVAEAAEKIQADEEQSRAGIRSGQMPIAQIEEQLKVAGYTIQ